MSALTVVSLLLIALLLDASSLGPDSIRDRLAFLMGLGAIHGGWAGSAFDAWTTNGLKKWLATGLHGVTIQDSQIPERAINAILAIAVAAVFLYAAGCLMPARFASRLGPLATTTFGGSEQYRINWRLWICAAILGVLGDVPGGLIGGCVQFLIGAATTMTGFIPGLLFGES